MSNNYTSAIPPLAEVDTMLVPIPQELLRIRELATTRASELTNHDTRGVKLKLPFTNKGQLTTIDCRRFLTRRAIPPHACAQSSSSKQWTFY